MFYHAGRLQRSRIRTAPEGEPSSRREPTERESGPRLPGHHLIRASSGEQGLELAERIAPDLILTDVRLPGINGCEVTRRLKSDARTASIPVVAVSAYAFDAERRNALEAGCVRYVTRPVRPWQLRAVVREVLGAGPSPVEAAATDRPTA